MMRKFTSAEGTAKVISPEVHKAIQIELSKYGATSARELSDSQRESLQIVVDESDMRC